MYRRKMKSAQTGWLRIGTAGWALPKALRVSDSAQKPVLQQYAQLFDVVEINSSFYRPHRRSTYERWREGVPEAFRFSVKVPKAITHELGLSGCQSETAAFMDSVSGLEHKLGALLVQLPRGRTFEARVAGAFFKTLRQQTPAQIVCEARSASWFDAAATAVLEAHRISRVIADPIPSGCEFAAPGDASFAYFRLHGSPRMYHSSYSMAYLQHVAAAARTAAVSWCIFDNTAAGAAWSDADMLRSFSGASCASTG